MGDDEVFWGEEYEVVWVGKKGWASEDCLETKARGVGQL